MRDANTGNLLPSCSTIAVEGMNIEEGQALIESLIAFAVQEKYVYSHRWQTGDVLIWDERATLHRGRPWPYEVERSLASVCVTAAESDGLNLVRPDQISASGQD